MDSGSVVADLKRLISAEGRSLLQSHNLLRPLVEQMVTSVAIADVAVTTEELDAARLDLLEQQGFESIDQWSRLVERLERPEQQVLGQLRRLIQRQTWMRDQFASKAEARFLERKNELDQVVYSLLRLKNSFLARELYLQIESEESNFSDLAKRYAEGPERNTNGIVGPVSLDAGPSRSRGETEGRPTGGVAGALPDCGLVVGRALGALLPRHVYG